ncbi:hypothetical protein N2605_23680 [Bradyrhizobium yuanmingense]|uniref:hypothetical protein n=1 Tax=Bradyrhizobium yuanmingense TaxID=108015 RepID=UPI0021A69BB5|nr:hypothetical protein [Bradyrhizobium sp. CB1024]UWU82597.1 hypothetical protein N2605_23680 [Bradyrhizobium sp. CB1024]
MAIEQFKKINDQAGIDATLASLRKLVAADRSLEHVLTDAVRKLAQADKLPQFEIALMERYVELAPDDHETRFNLAYKQSEVGAEAIALHHYQRIPLGDRHAATWNNIGYARDQLGLPVTSVSAYRQSANMGNTLAMSNLANKLIKAGFLDLAREQCNEALKIPNPHQNVGHLVATLASVEEAERTRKDEILKDASDRIAHLRKLGRAATAATPQTFPEGWKGPQCVFTLSRCGDRITLKGTYETEAGGLLAALMSPNAPSGALSLPTSKHTVTFTGQIRGLAVVGSVKREREGASLLDSAGENVVAMIFSDACDEITIIEDLTSDQQTIQVLTRI